MKIINSMVDQQLLNQMKDLIIRTTDEGAYDKLLGWNCLFGAEASVRNMEEQYNLKYPGEVLERYEERCGGGRSQTLALALALAETKPLLGQTMFVGTQYKDFMRKVRELSKDDFCMYCILLLLTERAEEEKQLFDGIRSHVCTGIEELIFAVYVLQNTKDAWEAVKKYGSCFLGKGRKQKAYGNVRLYIWLLRQFAEDIRKCRGKDVNVLKALLELSCKYVKKETTIWNRLQEAGYSAQEILYLNLLIPGEFNTPKALKQDSITMERMALAGVRELFNSEIIEDPSLFGFCGELIKKYRRYNICLEGKAGILESLNDGVQIKNKGLFQYLYKRKIKENLPEKWFYTDFGKQGGCSIHTWMDPDEFTELFGASMIYYKDIDIDIWLKNYQECTGKCYSDIFWKADNYKVRSVFELFVSKKKINFEYLLEEYSDDEKQLPEKELGEKWSAMRNNITSAVGRLNTHEAYLFWDAFDKKFGISHLDTFLLHNNTVLNAVGIESYSRCFRYLNFKENILTAMEQTKLFDWVEQEVYKKVPDQYDRFLYTFLMMDTAKKIFPEESRELFYMIKEDVSETEKYSLCQKYYTESEWNVFQENEKKRKEEQKRKQKQAELEEYKEEVYKELQGAGKESEVIEKITERMPGYSWEGEKAAVCLELLKEHLRPVGYAKRNTIARLAEKLFRRFEYKKIELKEVLDILGKMEVTDDESTED